MKKLLVICILLSGITPVIAMAQGSDMVLKTYSFKIIPISQTPYSPCLIVAGLFHLFLRDNGTSFFGAHSGGG